MSGSVQVVDFTKHKASCHSCALREICLPKGLEHGTREQLDVLINHPARLEQGVQLYRPGDGLRALYAIKTGSVKIHAPMSNGDEQIVGFHLPGELIGLDALATDLHTCAASALETTTVCEIPIAKIHQLSRTHDSIRQQLNRLMGAQLTHMRELLMLVGKKSAEGRVAGFLLNLSQRFGARGLSPHQFNLSMSRLDIANYLGLAVETVSRVFSRFQDEGLLTVRARHIHIHNLERLRALVHSGTTVAEPFRPHRRLTVAESTGARGSTHRDELPHPV